MEIKLGINGLGRIGRNILRLILEEEKKSHNFKLVINDLSNIQAAAHLIKYDSTLGSLNQKIEIKENKIIIQDLEILFYQSKRTDSKYPWKENEINLVIDATGEYSKEIFSFHKESGAKKIIATGPTDQADVTIVMGINESEYNPNKHFILSNASCTTNCLAPLIKVIDTEFGLKGAHMNTIHSFTSDQRILDNYHHDLRRARAASLSMIPTTTGAIKSIEKILPHLKGKIQGIAVRVPVPNVSLLDLVFETKKSVSISEINNQFKKYSEESLKNILSYSEEPLVSIDYQKNPHSAILDSLSTSLIEEKSNQGYLAHILAWYNNEWAYAKRIIDLLYFIIRT